MQEDRAAEIARARPDVPAEHQHHIVEMVPAVHALMAAAIGQAHRPVVVAVGGQVAPAEVRPYRIHRQPGLQRRPAIAVIAGDYPHRLQRRAAVALALQGDDAGAAERAAHDAISGYQNALRRRAGAGAHGENQPLPGDISAILVAVTDFGV